MTLLTSEPDHDKLMTDSPPAATLMNSEAEYQTKLGAAYQGDSRDLLTELPDNCIDLVVTSPPFALQHQKEYGNEEQGSYNDWFMGFVPEMRRLLQRSEVAAIPEVREDVLDLPDPDRATDAGAGVRY